MTKIENNFESRPTELTQNQQRIFNFPKRFLNLKVVIEHAFIDTFLPTIWWSVKAEMKRPVINTKSTKSKKGLVLNLSYVKMTTRKVSNLFNGVSKDRQYKENIVYKPCHNAKLNYLTYFILQCFVWKEFCFISAASICVYIEDNRNVLWKTITTNRLWKVYVI